MSNQSEILLVTPPFTQLNTPYPATAYLKGFLKTKDIHSSQMDLGIETILVLFSNSGLSRVFENFDLNILQEKSKRVFTQSSEYISTIDQTILFLQGNQPSLAKEIVSRKFLPESSRFDQKDILKWSLEGMDETDQAKYLCTLYLEDLGDFINETVDPHFGFSRYAERLGRSASTFDEIHEELQKPLTLVEEMMLEVFESKFTIKNFKLICLSIPFPGNLFSAFRCAQFIKKNFPSVKTAMGGGFPNTELRSISEKRVFEYFDFITLDDGERPLLNLLEYLDGKRELKNLKRTFALEDSSVKYFNNSSDPDFALRETGTPDYSDLPLNKYISVIEVANPMHKMWSDGRWNKLTLAHGCYWGKCTFCDISLDYIQRYEPANAKMICDRIEELIEQTGNRGFHFVDEAAPPSLMKEMAIELLKRDLKIIWWTNIRFEKNFTADLCKLLKASGCVAISGGLEVASDRLLSLIDKGVTVEQVAKVTADFTAAGIMVHAYLMYGFPSQTAQETIDSLEMVRQMFEADIVQSGFWHQFALTAHSPVGLNPEKYGVRILNEKIGTFANNDLEFEDSVGLDHSQFSEGLKKSLFNFMNETGFDLPLQSWFETKVPTTKIDKEFIEDAIVPIENEIPKDHHRVLWIGKKPKVQNKGKKTEFIFSGTKRTVILNSDHADWFISQLENISYKNEKSVSYKEWADTFRERFDQPFAFFYLAGETDKLKEEGLLVL